MPLNLHPFLLLLLPAVGITSLFAESVPPSPPPPPAATTNVVTTNMIMSVPGALPSPFPQASLTTSVPVSSDAAPHLEDVRPESPAFKSVNPEQALVSPVAINSRKPNALDLQTCFQLTAVRNDTLKISLQDIFIARARLSQAIANLFPTFMVNNRQEFIHYNAPSRGGVSFSNSVSSGFTSGDRNYESSSNVTMSYTLFNGGQNFNNIASGQATLESKKLLLERNYQTIYQSVAQAFYEVLQYEGDLVVQGDLSEALKARVKELEDRVRIGRSRPAELLQAQVDLANAQVTIEQTKGALGASRETLAFYIGLPAHQITLKETQKFPSADSIEAYLQHSGARPDILAEYQNLRAYERTLDSARGQLFPTITAQGDFLASQDPNSNRVDATMTLEASLPIFDGGLILSRINENKQLVRQEQLNVDNLMRTADEDIRTAYNNFNSSAAQVLVLRQAASLAAQNFQGQLIDYRRGVVTNLDVLTALQDYHNARQQLHNADMSARINLINLHVASGLAATSPGVNNKALPTALNLTPPPPPQKFSK